MKNRDLTLSYSLIQGTFWMAFAVISGFASLYLLDCGFTNTQIGMIIAVAGLISAVLQPMVAGLADKPGKLSPRVLSLLLGAAQIGCGCLLPLVKGSMVLTCMVYGAAIALLQVIMPLVNSMGIADEQAGDRLNFGAARCLGSIGYAVTAYVLGAVSGKTGSICVPVGMAIGFALFLLVVFRFPAQKKQASAAGAGAGSSPVQFVKKYPRFCLVLMGTTLIYVSHALLNSFTLQIVQSKGGSSAEMGTAVAIAALIELPTMFVFNRMRKIARCDTWVKIAGIFFTLKILFSMLCTTMTGFYTVQLLQIMGWALMSVSSVFFIDAVMAPEDAVKGQAYFTMTYTLGSVLGATVGGWLIDLFGVPQMLLFGTVGAAIGTMILFLFAEKAE